MKIYKNAPVYSGVNKKLHYDGCTTAFFFGIMAEMFPVNE